jgi:hypothetical protein
VARGPVLDSGFGLGRHVGPDALIVFAIRPSQVCRGLYVQYAPKTLFLSRISGQKYGYDHLSSLREWVNALARELVGYVHGNP